MSTMRVENFWRLFQQNRDSRKKHEKGSNGQMISVRSVSDSFLADVYCVS